MKNIDKTEEWLTENELKIVSKRIPLFVKAFENISLRILVATLLIVFTKQEKKLTNICENVLKMIHSSEKKH